jgi:stage IV sporulation protein FB
MILNEPEPTSGDLHFRLFGIRIRVSLWFWVMTAVLGFNLSRLGIEFLLIWIACVFVSILIHEMGHVFVGRYFGSDGHIVLTQFGGLAVGSNDLRNRWQRVAVSFGGPAAQLLLYAGLYFLPRPLGIGWLHEGWVRPVVLLNFTIEELMFINLYWPILNLLPIWPLDGGQITREVCVGASRENGALTAYWISLVLAAVLAVNALVGAQAGNEPFIPFAPTGTYTAIFFALFAVGSWQMIQVEQQSRRRSSYDDDLPWER